MKVAIIIPHYKTARLTAGCIHAFKQYGWPVEHEIVLCDNSPGHWSIKAISETPLGEGIKIVPGDPDFPSHGQGYWAAYNATDADWIFCAESDSFPIRCGWADEYIKASADYDLIGPDMPMAAGRYIHPAGALYRRTLIESARDWQKAQRSIFCNDMAIMLGLSHSGYHAVVMPEFLERHDLPEERRKQIEMWHHAGPWQEMRSYDDDFFSTYGDRVRITNWEPQPGREHWLRIGYEPGQWLSYFASANGFRCLKAPLHIEWMPNMTGQQAAYSDVFSSFRHLWAGTSATVVDGLSDTVKQFKRQQVEGCYSLVPSFIRDEIEKLERNNQ